MIGRTILIAIVLSVAICNSRSIAMLSFPEENEFHCRSCHAPSGATTSDLHHRTKRARSTGCIGCHPRSADTTFTTTVRDCKACHVNPGTADPFTGIVYAKSPHHRSLDNSECLACHTVDSILYQTADPYAGAADPAPLPIQPELTEQAITFPVKMNGVPQTQGILDSLYPFFPVDVCRSCHTPPGDESTANLHHRSEKFDTDGCTYCHAIDGVIQVPMERTCLSCHVSPGNIDPFTRETYSKSVHHRTAAATSENCTFCHSTSSVRSPGTGFSPPYAPQSSPSLATPTPKSCLNCHATGVSGSRLDKLHHAASENCALCHSFGDEQSAIRDCESCHTFESLHGITGHTSGTDRCIGCHGDYLATQPPVLEVSLLSREIYTDTRVINIAGRAFSSTGINSLTINGIEVPRDEAGNFSHPQTLTAGLNTITIKASGTNGAEASDTRLVTLIGVTADMDVTTPADNSTTSSPDLPLEGTAPTLSRIIIKHNKNKEQRLIPWRGKYGTTVKLEPGINTIEISTIEKRQTITRKRTVTYTPAQPTLAITVPAQDQVVSVPVFNVEGHVPEGAVITVFKDGEAVSTFSAAGKFTLPLSLEEQRAHRIEMMATDRQGRKASVVRNILVKRR